MKREERQTRSHLMELFAEHGFHPRGKLGQNFLIDLNILEFIVAQAELGPDDVVLEVGSGTGGMTVFLAEQAAEVVSVEIDPNMHSLASEVTARFPNATLLNCDALRNKNNFEPMVLATVREKLTTDPNRQLKLVANLPYHVATPIVSNLVASDLPWTRMVITIQLELADKMAAGPGSSHYGALSVWLQSQGRVKIAKRMGPTVFWPRPKVESAVVRIERDADLQQKIRDGVFFQDFVRRLFQQRRKLLRSGLVGMYGKQLSKPEIDAVLAEAGLNDGIRAENCDVAGLVELANRFSEAIEAAGKSG